MSSVLVIVTAGAAAVLEGLQAPGHAELVRGLLTVTQHFTLREQTTQQQVKAALQEQLRGWDLHKADNQLLLSVVLDILKDYQCQHPQVIAQSNFDLNKAKEHLRRYAQNSHTFKAFRGKHQQDYLAANALTLLATALEVVSRSPEWRAEQESAAQQYMAANFQLLQDQLVTLQELLQNLNDASLKLSLLTLPARLPKHDLKKKSAPGRLLVAGNAVVPFTGQERLTLRDQLLDWAQRLEHEDSEPVRILYGQGGTGKTRLLTEVVKQFRANGNAGFLSATTLDTIRELFPLPNDEPTLLVVDYAEQKDPQVLKALIEAVQRRREQGYATNLVLLARTASTAPGSWLDTLQTSLGSSILPLIPEQIVPPQPQDRQAIYNAALQAFQPYTNPENQHPTFSPPDLTRDTFNPVLFVLIAALAAAQGHDPAELNDAETLLNYALEREQEYVYNRIAANSHTKHLNKVKDVARILIATAAIGYIFNSNEDVEKACTELLKKFTGEATSQLSALLCDLYPRQAIEGLTKIQPDLLAEHWIDKLQPTDWAQVLRFIPSNPEKMNFGEATTVLLAIAERTGRAERLNEFAKHFAFEMALMGNGLQMAMSAKSGLLARVFEDHLPSNALSQIFLLFLNDLRHPLGLSVRLRGLAEKLNRQRLDSGDQSDKERALNLVNLSVDLANLGRREEALQATQEAVTLYRSLAHTNPDAFNPDLAMSLNNLGSDLSNLGRREEALQATQQAVTLYRSLAHTNPDVFNPDLAMSLGNLSHHLHASGDLQGALVAAQESLALFRLLEGQQPGAFGHHLAQSLNILGDRLKDMNDWAAALPAYAEAVRLLQPYAQQYPQAFRQQLQWYTRDYLEACQQLGVTPDPELASTQKTNVFKGWK